MPISPLRLQALGIPIDVHCTGDRADEARDALSSRWQLCHRDEDDPAAEQIEVRLGDEVESYGYSDDRRTVGTPELASTMANLTHAVTRLAIEGNRGRLLMLHAGAVSSLDTGATVVAIAAGGTGKTTLCRTLAPGRGYVTDETVGIRADHTIVAYPKPLSVRRSDGRTKDEVDPVAAGLERPRAAPYVAAVLLLDRDDEAPTDAEVEELDVFDAIVAIAPETSSLSRLEEPLHRLERLLESVALVARVRYRDAVDLGPLTDELIGAAR